MQVFFDPVTLSLTHQGQVLEISGFLVFGMFLETNVVAHRTLDEMVSIDPS